MKKDITWIEVSRTILMLSVVLIECSNYYFFENIQHMSLLQSATRLALYVGVPGFFILSGFVLGININKQLNRSEFILKKLKTLIIPFFIWNIIYIICTHFWFNYDIFTPLSMSYLITGYYSMYFLLALIQLFIVYAVMYKFIKNNPTAWLVISLIISVVFYIIMDGAVWTKIDLKQSTEWISLRLIFPWLFFFSLGIYLGIKQQILQTIQKYSWILLALAIVSLYVYAWEASVTFDFAQSMPRSYFYVGGFFYQTFAALLIVIIAQKIAHYNGVFSNYLTATGKDTFAIYLAVQLPLGFIGMTALANYKMTHVVSFIVFNFIVTFFGLQIIIRLIRKYNLRFIQKYLFGGH